MSAVKCPGQDRRFWKATDIFESPCPHCTATIEFWKDDPRRRCGGCGRVIRNPRIDLGCAKWCKYAAQCLGHTPSGDTAEESVCDLLVSAMRDEFGKDRSRVEHALRVLAYAEDILAVEGGTPLVVKAAAILHEAAIHDARRIMADTGLDETTIERVGEVIAIHRNGEESGTVESRILWDADRLADMPRSAGQAFRTETGRAMAAQLAARVREEGELT